MMMEMQLRRISILGVGLMGGSVGLACTAIANDCLICGYSHNTDELQIALDRGAIHEAMSDPMLAVANADLMILCTPPGSFAKLLQQIAPCVRRDAIVTDVGSTKRAIVEAAGKWLPSPSRFVGSHPMAGGEKHGIANAREDLLTGALCIITPTKDTEPDALETVEQFWKLLKMRTVRMSSEKHDELTSSISHLPHAIAAALVRAQSPEALQLAARGFLDSTRIAAGDSAMWRDILLENRDNLKVGIGRMQDELQQLLNLLDAGDAAAVQQWLSAAAQVRRTL